MCLLKPIKHHIIFHKNNIFLYNNEVQYLRHSRGPPWKKNDWGKNANVANARFQ